MLRALTPPAAAGDDVALKLRDRMSMALDAGMDPDEVADAVLDQLFHHLDHSDCEYHRTALLMWKGLVNWGITDAYLYINDPTNHGNT